MYVAVEHFDVGVGLDLAAQHFAGTIQTDAGDLDSVAHDLERNLLEVEDDIGGVLRPRPEWG
jgi:hypothetical protein